jgi:tRNA threonylcarbamoyladenosine biosynthesis protein TsaB
MILCLRADSPDVYIGLWENSKEKSAKSWQAGRELSTQILSVIEEICKDSRTTLGQISGIVVFAGPGSYTGLRISISVANALAYSNQIPISGLTGDVWIQSGTEQLTTIDKFKPISPMYGGEVYTTKPKK